ncbi:SDR family NAD(P)-dependent oxidoreductase [Paludisphaera borealis]|uniref:3-oxoacyl-[acyl-carrier-protein] reductase FabG n=1 Tax=Paludisphaera borealis TaxID=1387353 RepID=A0A1U7CUW0_9BACT|nr:SDR family NAD(P)-dependent oxidoreductase [Paludisphaera borealis]APW62679.1 3-oxoacyl-[acyl-carrier-protein] reductase FabG [Paludisphaera borealis]
MSIVIDLAGKTALVTGASQGIGAEIARRLHRAGARVAINHPDLGDGRPRADAEAIAAELNVLRDDSALATAADVSDPDAVRAMMQDLQQRWGGLDLLINNAGVLREHSLSKITIEEWREVVSVNLSGVFHCCKYGLEILRDGGGIVCMGSLAAEAGFHGQSAYAATKAGVQAMVRVLAGESARRGIRVNAVAPGVIDTPMIAGLADGVRTQLVKSIALRRLGRAEEVADAVVFLCSPLASYITGHTLDVNGGFGK